MKKVKLESEARQEHFVFNYKIRENNVIRTFGPSKSVCGGGTNHIVPFTFENAGAQAPASPFSYALAIQVQKS